MERQNMLLVPGRLFEILGFEHRSNRVDVAAQYAARKGRRDKQALAARGRDRVVHGVVSERWDDPARANALQSIGSRDAAEVDVIEIGLRRCGFYRNTRNVVSI